MPTTVAACLKRCGKGLRRGRYGHERAFSCWHKVIIVGGGCVNNILSLSLTPLTPAPPILIAPGQRVVFTVTPLGMDTLPLRSVVIEAKVNDSRMRLEA